jgi:phage gpG-like protein
MSFSIKTNNSNIFLAAMQAQLEAAFEECGLDAEYYAAKACPVDTGRLRASITHEVEGTGKDIKMVIGTNVEYAPFVEDGTTRQRMQSFIEAKQKKSNRNLKPWETKA